MVGDTIGQRDIYYAKYYDVLGQVNNIYIDHDTATTSDYANAEYQRYELWDKFLNEVYKALQSSLSSSEMETLKIEQRAWITTRDNVAAESQAASGDGSQGAIAYNSALAEFTEIRCYDLITIYMK